MYYQSHRVLRLPHFHIQKSSVIAICILILSILLTSCSSRDQRRPRDFFSADGDNVVHFVPASFSNLKKWESDDHLAALKTFRTSCRAIRFLKPNGYVSRRAVVAPKAREWLNVCQIAQSIPNDRKAAKRFWERYFSVYKILNHNGHETGKITGYFKIAINGSLRKTARYRYPIYRPPQNITKIAGTRSISRGAIENGVLNGRGLELAWTDDLGKLYALHIQGSGIINLPNGKRLSINYCRGNGFRFRSLQKPLRRYNMQKANLLQLAEWFRKHPNLYKSIIVNDPSYTFFSLSPNTRTVGSQGVALTPGRSIAIDSRIFPYLTPMWIESYLPKTKYRKRATFIRRLMIAQDRGPAICGGPRCDVFCGSGNAMEMLGHNLSSPSIHYVLFPRRIPIEQRYNY